MSLNTPILFIVFNRPDTTARVFERIREIKPKQLYVAADGPRLHKLDDKEKCKATQAIILNGVDWDCELKTLFREENLGCGLGVSSAITWFFENVEQGIILEDDCLPDLSFFSFCTEILNYYHFDENVMHVGGTNSQFGIKRGIYSYYFSKYPHIWGWATWRTAWQKFQYSFSNSDQLRVHETMKEYKFSKQEKKYWLEHWLLIKDGNRNNTWDFQWTFSCWLNKGITIVPNLNLISNIGFNENATHTTNIESKLATLSTSRIEIVHHPIVKKIDTKADKFTFDNFNLLKLSLSVSFKNGLSKMIPHSIKSILRKLIS